MQGGPRVHARFPGCAGKQASSLATYFFIDGSPVSDFLGIIAVAGLHCGVCMITSQFLFQTLSEMTAAEQRAFLCFATGSPRLPIGGKHDQRHNLCLV